MTYAESLDAMADVSVPHAARLYQNVVNCSVGRQLLPADVSVCSTAANLQAQSQNMVGSIAQ